MAEEKSLHRMPVADCGDYAEIIVRGVAEIRNPSLSRMPVGRLWVFEVGERSEVGALESSHNVNEVNHFREA